MVSFKNLILGSVISLGMFCTDKNIKPPMEENTNEIKIELEISDYIDSEKIISPRGRVYDTLTGRFVKNKGGLDESILNKYNPLIRKDEIWMYRMVDSIEFSSNVSKRDSLEGGLSNLSMRIIMYQNFWDILRVDTTSFENLDPKYFNLKRVLNDLDSIHNLNGLNSYQKASKMFDKIYEKIHLKERKDDIPIYRVLNGEDGDCSDVTSTFYPLFKYFGYDAGFGGGKVCLENGNSVLHVWPSMKFDSSFFDFDPSWYPFFIPLETRIKESSFSFSEFETKKYNSPHCIKD